MRDETPAALYFGTFWGWRAASASGLQGKGSPERSVITIITSTIIIIVLYVIIKLLLSL